jgi:hypothetical protein
MKYIFYILWIVTWGFGICLALMGSLSAADMILSLCFGMLGALCYISIVIKDILNEMRGKNGQNTELNGSASSEIVAAQSKTNSS